jgi:hypothetical protein
MHIILSKNRFYLDDIFFDLFIKIHKLRMYIINCTNYNIILVNVYNIVINTLNKTYNDNLHVHIVVDV